MQALTFTTLWINSADDKLAFFIFFQKISFDISCKVSLETICIKYQSLFSGKIKIKQPNCCLLKVHLACRTLTALHAYMLMTIFWSVRLFWDRKLCGPRHGKHVFGHIRTSKDQFGLRIHTVWSGPFLSTNRIIGCYRMIERRAKPRWIFVRSCLFAWHHENMPIYFWSPFITKTRLYKHIENFTTKKTENFQIKIPIFFFFSYFFSKHRLLVLVRTASPRRFYRVPTIYVFEEK